jgi:predicted DsbA family dithiol-disulfide isomerase
MFEAVDLPFAGKIEKIPNSRGSLMLGELARDHGVLDELHPRLFDAYWGRGLDIGDAGVLIEEGTGVGLSETDISAVLEDERYLPRIEASTRNAINIGAGGVPAWAIDRRILVPGAQPHEVFTQVLEQLGYAPLNGESDALGESR